MWPDDDHDDAIPSDNSLFEIRFERAVSRWLDDRIAEAAKYCQWMSRASGASAKHDGRVASPPSPSPSPSNDRDALLLLREKRRQQQQHLLALTSQWQLQHRLLRRCLVFQQQQQLEPPPPGLHQQTLPGTKEPLPRGRGPEESTQRPPGGRRRELLEAALSARDRRATEALRLDLELSRIREQFAAAREECDRLIRWNRALWSQVRDSRRERREDGREERHSSGSSKAPVALENRVLKRVVTDLVVGAGSSCGVDWYADDRLLGMVTRS
jgi:hypothetical protein